MEDTTKSHGATVYPILLAVSLAHLFNDTIQSLIPAMYPVVKANYHLSFSQVGLITLFFQLTASFLQPFIGIYTDKYPKIYSLAFGMLLTLCGLLLLANASNFNGILGSVVLVGAGSSVFHPEASRIAYSAAGSKKGFAQSLFQLGGNFGHAIGPLLAAWIIVPYGQDKLLYFSVIAIAAFAVHYYIGKWYRQALLEVKTRTKSSVLVEKPKNHRKKIVFSILLLLVLLFSKNFYTVSISSYFTFYLMEKFGVSIQTSQVYLFLFLLSAAIGTLVGGIIGDKIGRKYVIWGSILGAAPFSIMLPYVNLTFTLVLIVLIGFIISSAFSAIIVYA